MTQTNKEHEGYLFYLLVKFIAEKQNELISEAEQMVHIDDEFIRRQSRRLSSNKAKKSINEKYPSTSLL
jgi:ribosomal protein S6